MKKVLFTLLIVWIGGCATLMTADEAPRMTREQLRDLLGRPDVIVIDVRYGKDWSESHHKIKGAVREDPENLKAWIDKYSPHQTLVLY